jgi:hypothetical protein
MNDLFEMFSLIFYFPRVLRGYLEGGKKEVT